MLSSLPVKVSHLFLELLRTQWGAEGSSYPPDWQYYTTSQGSWGVEGERLIFLFSSSQIHLKYFGSFILYSFIIQPFQVRKTETQICNLHTSYSLDVCVGPHLRDLEPKYS